MAEAVIIVALVVGLGLGWWGGRRAMAAVTAERDSARAAQAAAEAEAARQQAERKGAAVEVESLQRRNAELVDAERERERLSKELAALQAREEERACAHAAELARVQDAFQTLAGKALDAAQARLKESAEELLVRQREAAGQTLEAGRNQLAELLTPVKETLGQYQARLAEIEQARNQGYGRLQEMLAQVAQGQDRVSGAALKLETALRSSGKVAGRWGEEQCRNVLESAGLVEGIDFETQLSVAGEEGRQQRPDFVVNLAGGRRLVIDVKCSLDHYVSAVEAADGDVRATLLAAHARAVRVHADGLAKKDYSKSIGGAVDFVVLFVPGENFLAAAIENDRALLNDFFRRHIVLAGPVNLVAVARTVAALRDQARLAKEAAEIARLGRDLYDSLRIMGGNFASVQKSLETAVGQWNKLVSQIDNRVIGRARRLKDMGAATGLDDLAELAPVTQTPTLPGASEFAALPDAAE